MEVLFVSRPGSTPPCTAKVLSGIRVLDLTTQIAGPTASRILADFGADVIKINQPSADLIAHVNRGKRTMLLDIQRPLGKQVLNRLIEDADVFLQNMAMGAAERYGFGYDSVRGKRPNIIYASVSTFAYSGPWGPRRGYEMQGGRWRRPRQRGRSQE